MRILRLDHEDGEGLELHPYVTVLGGLAPEAQRRVVDRLVRLARGDAEGTSGLVEAQDVLAEITPEAVAALGLPPDADVLVRAEQLPGAQIVGGDPAGSIDEQIAARRAAVDALEVQLIAASEAVTTATSRLDEARRGLDDFAITAHDAAIAALRDAEAAAAASLRAAPPPVDERTRLTDELAAAHAAAAEVEAQLDAERLALLELLEDLEAERAALDELRAGADLPPAEEPTIEEEPVGPEVPPAEVVDAVSRALELVRRGPPETPMVPSAEAQALAEQIAAHRERHDGLERELRDEGIDVVGLQQQLLDAQVEAEQAEVDARPKVVSPDDDAEIERLHDIVVEQGEKRFSRRGGKGAEAAYEEASAALDALLERVGYPTYAAYVMGRIAPSIDVDARRRVQEAQERVAELEARLDEAASILERDARVLMLRAERDQLWAAARDLLGTLPDDVEGALRDLRVTGESAFPAVDELRDLLDVHGIARHGDDEAAVSSAASRFLDEAAAAAAELEALRAAAAAPEPEPEPETDTVEDRIGRGERRVAELHRLATEADAALAEQEAEFDARTREVEAVAAALDAAEAEPRQLVPDIDPRIAQDPRVVQARDQLAMTEARLARHRTAVEQVDLRHAELREARTAERTLTVQRDRAREELEALGGATGGGVDLRPLPEIEWTLDDRGIEAIEWYLLGRVAALRQVSHAGSAPLILDDAFRGLPEGHVRDLCEVLARVGESVQVLYLGESPTMAEWAAAQGLDRAAVVRPGQPAI